MDAFQESLARIALDAVGDRGFVLGGGHAVQLHDMAARLSEDIDLFSADRGRPAEVEADVAAAFGRHQLTVTVIRRTPDLVQMMVSGPGGETCKVDLGIFWRARELSGRYDRRQLEALLLEHNPGFGAVMFAESLGFLARIPDREFEAYGVDKEHVAAMRAYFGQWQHELRR